MEDKEAKVREAIELLSSLVTTSTDTPTQRQGGSSLRQPGHESGPSGQADSEARSESLSRRSQGKH